MPDRYYRPALFVVLFILFVTAGGFATSVRFSSGPFASGPTQDDLWPETEDWARTQLAGMTLEEKIAQLFSARAYSRYTSEDDPAYQKLVDLVERFEIGGITFFQGEPMEQATLANDLQRRARVPLLISQDMEWGAGMRIEHTTTLPRTMALGATRDEGLAFIAGYVTAREARALGTHQVFAPVADVNNNPNNPIINVRSFGEEPDLVAELATAFARGVQAGGAISTAKHFPGHGDTATDSHSSLPVLPFGMDRLETLELVPFRNLVNDGIMSIMTGHLAFPEVTSDPNLPASLSPRVTSEILRDELGFNGIIVTDALDMAGVTAHYGTGEAAVRALEAGADMLLLSEDPYAARAAIIRAVEDGRITEDRIDASVMRILRAKAWAGLDENRLVDVDAVREIVASSGHLAVSETIARRSLTLLRNQDDLIPLDEETRILLVTLSDGDDPGVGDYFAAQLRSQAPAAQIERRLLDNRTGEGAYSDVLDDADDFDVVVVPAFVYVRSWSGRINLSEDNLDFLSDLSEDDTPVVLISFGNPYIVMGLEEQPDVYISAYSASEASQKAAAEALFGKSGFRGTLPITIPGHYAFGEGIQLRQGMIHDGFPAEVGMSVDTLAYVDSLIYASIADGAFPGAALAIGRAGAVVKKQAYGYYTYDKIHPVTARSQFDLASLTKVVATTTAVMKLYDEGRIALNDRVIKYLPEFGQNGKDVVTIRQLMTHSAGLIPFRAFHQMGITTRKELIDAIMAEELIYKPGTDSRYSDLGMITMMLIIEKITGEDFATYVEREIFEPLGMRDTGFREVGRPDPNVVPTELDDYFRNRLIQGEVHDETAWILGGTSGHAGLFSTVDDLIRFAYMLIHEGRVNGEQFIDPEIIRDFTRVQNPSLSTRALGWDTRSPNGYSSAGDLFGPNSFGHTGFTGTSFWIDPDQDLFVILLTNRVYPTRENHKISRVRPEVANIAYRSILGPPELVGPAVAQ